MLLEDLQVVMKVAELRSITAAATQLDLRSATASAALKRVEAALGAPLFVRSTRQLRLSKAGERYIPQCQQALLMLEQAKHSLQNELDRIEGELRIAVSSDLGRNLVMPWLDAFLEQYPKLSIRLSVNDSNIDFYRDNVDMALRYGSPQEAQLYGFKIATIPRLICASPDYLAQHGTPQHPDQLAAHNGLFYQLYDSIHNRWTLYRDGTAYKIKMNGNRAGNDGDLVRRWCVAGRGVALKSSIEMSADLFAGRVVRLLPEYQADATELWLLTPNRHSITPAVRLLRDFIQQKSVALLQQLAQHGLINPSELKRGGA